MELRIRRLEVRVPPSAPGHRPLAGRLWNIGRAYDRRRTVLDDLPDRKVGHEDQSRRRAISGPLTPVKNGLSR